MKKSKAWGMFIVLYLSCLAIGLTQMKVPPVMVVLSGAFNVSMTSVAWLSNVFYIAGIVLAIPGAIILNKLGPKKMGLGILLFLAIGNFLGWQSNDFNLLLISRLIEGIGFSFGTMLGIVLISQWFEPKTANIVIGIFSTFPAAGAMIMLNFGAGWAASMGWRSLWIMCGIYSVVMGVLYALVIKTPDPRPQPEGVPAPPKVSMKEGMLNGKALLMGICFGCSIFVLMAFSNLYFTIFMEYYATGVQKASMYAGLTGGLGIVFSIFSGILVARTGKPAVIILLSFVCLTITCFFTFMLGSDTAYLAHVIGITLFTGLIIPAVLCLAPSTAKHPQFIGAAMALINLVYFIGGLLSTPVVAAVCEKSGWPAGRIPLLIVCAIGIFVSIIFMAVDKKKAPALTK